MNIESLKYFINVAESLNFTKAAKKSNISQTAMSFQIANMEKELGFVLFHRDRRSVQLTKAGEYFYEQVCGIVTEYEVAVSESKKIESDTELRLVFASSYLADHFVEHLNLFQSQNPQIDLKVLIREPTKIVSCLENNEADVAVALVYDMGEKKSMYIEAMREYPVYVYTGKKSEFAGYDVITADMLPRENIVVCDPKEVTGSYQEIFDCGKNYGYEPKSYIVTDSVEEIVLNIGIGKGFSLMPRYVMEHNAQAKNMAEVPFLVNGEQLTFLIGVGCLKKNYNTSIKKLIKILKQ